MKRNLLFVAAGIMLFFMSACDNIHNPFLPEKKENGGTKHINPNEPVYTVMIIKIGNVPGDALTCSPNKGNEGNSITLYYTVVDAKHYNLLNFDGVTVPIDSVDSAESGERTYTINVADASNGVITIIAVFTHTNLVPDPIVFEINAAHITKTYGDEAFPNAITTEHNGSGAITYSSSDTTVATLNSSGQVTIHKAGSAIITAEKAADATYAEALKTYTLTVNPKPVTITGLSAADKQYDGNTTATVTGTAVISGLVVGDTVTVGKGIATFNNATAGNGKTVTFSGWSLTGADAGNYRLSAQPANVTANIEFDSMVLIPAGTFTMGRSENDEGEIGASELPQHSVTLTRSFYMGKYKVTQALYQLVMGTNPSHFKSAVPGESGTPGRLPVEMVRWYDALVFCNKLSVMEGLSPAYSISGSTDPAAWGTVPTSSDATWNAVVIVADSNGYRLPTEAQWEYACRAGTITAYNTGNTISDNTGWYTVNSAYMTHQVGLKPANAWGLYDMHGNVYEWCWDWCEDYSSEAQTDPMGASSGTFRMLRGGSWGNAYEVLRSAFRDYEYPHYQSQSYGFRLVRP